jgi:hypothetical protein
MSTETQVFWPLATEHSTGPAVQLRKPLPAQHAPPGDWPGLLQLRSTCGLRLGQACHASGASIPDMKQGDRNLHKPYTVNQRQRSSLTCDQLETYIMMASCMLTIC